MPQTWWELSDERWLRAQRAVNQNPRWAVRTRACKDLTLPPTFNYPTESGLTCLSSEHYSQGFGRRRCQWIWDSSGANTSASWTGRSWGLIMGRNWGDGGVSPFPASPAIMDPVDYISCPLRPRWTSSPLVPQVQQPHSTSGEGRQVWFLCQELGGWSCRLDYGDRAASVRKSMWKQCGCQQMGAVAF